MTTHGASIRLLAAVALTTLAALSAAAQTITDPNKKIVAPGTTAKPVEAKPTTAKPAGAAAGAAGKTSAKPKLSDQTSTDYWAINTDLGKYSQNAKPTPTTSTPLTRQPLRGADGTIGLTAGDVRPATLGNGAVAAGMERYNQTPDSYAGMSLSISSPDKNFPLLPRNSSW